MEKDFKKYLKKIKGKVGAGIKIVGIWRFTLENIITGEKEVKYYHNLITTAGLSAICEALTNGAITYNPLITHASLGTDNTPVSVADVALGAEDYRNSIASRTFGDNVAYLTAFYSAVECAGSYKEAGLIIDGTGEDILFNHVNIDVVKTNLQKLTIDTTITLVNA